MTRRGARWDTCGRRRGRNQIRVKKCAHIETQGRSSWSGDNELVDIATP